MDERLSGPKTARFNGGEYDRKGQLRTRRAGNDKKISRQKFRSKKNQESDDNVHPLWEARLQRENDNAGVLQIEFHLQVRAKLMETKFDFPGSLITGD